LSAKKDSYWLWIARYYWFDFIPKRAGYT